MGQKPRRKKKKFFRRKEKEGQLLGKNKELVKRRKVCYLEDQEIQCISIPKQNAFKKNVGKSVVTMSQKGQGT